jgi:hypothetical protein
MIMGVKRPMGKGFMKNFTVEQLINAIRSADDLGELKRMVGADNNASELSSKRITEIDRLWDRYYANAANESDIPIHIKEKYEQLNAEQSAFEAEYC